MELLTGVLGIFLRLIVPVGATIFIGWVLYKLDAHWQTEAEKRGILTAIRNSGCWKTNNCSPEKMKDCAAYLHQEMPCWQACRGKDGCLKEACLGCKLFRQAPSPAAS